MLVLSRQRDETIMIGDDVEITVVDVRGDKVRLGINAPRTVQVHRKEVYEAIRRENDDARNVSLDDLAGAPRGASGHPRSKLGDAANGPVPGSASTPGSSATPGAFANGHRNGVPRSLAPNGRSASVRVNGGRSRPIEPLTHLKPTPSRASNPSEGS